MLYHFNMYYFLTCILKSFYVILWGLLVKRKYEQLYILIGKPNHQPHTIHIIVD